MYCYLPDDLPSVVAAALCIILVAVSPSYKYELIWQNSYCFLSVNKIFHQAAFLVLFPSFRNTHN